MESPTGPNGIPDTVVTFTAPADPSIMVDGYPLEHDQQHLWLAECNSAGWLTNLDTLAAMGFETFYPGHGPKGAAGMIDEDKKYIQDVCGYQVSSAPMALFDPFPLLTTPRLRLRCPELDDAAIMFENLTHPEAARFGGKAPPATVEATREKLEKVLATIRAGEGISWALVDIETGAYLGSAGLWRWDKPHFRAELGYEIAARVWGRGLMPEAVAPILAFGFQRMDLHSIEAKVHPANTASIRVVEKLGFQREALFRENHWNGVEFEDTAVYSLLTPG